jgi:hypothetical protein
LGRGCEVSSMGRSAGNRFRILWRRAPRWSTSCPRKSSRKTTSRVRSTCPSASSRPRPEGRSTQAGPSSCTAGTRPETSAHEPRGGSRALGSPRSTTTWPVSSTGWPPACRPRAGTPTGHEPVERVMRPGPSTFRPHVPIEDLTHFMIPLMPSPEAEHGVDAPVAQPLDQQIGGDPLQDEPPPTAIRDL